VLDALRASGICRRTAVAAAVTAAMASLVLAATPAEAANLARGRVWRWTRAPNYARCTDARDSLQLSDGRRAVNEYMWGDERTVGWELLAGDAVGFQIDLGSTTWIDSVIVHTSTFPPAGVHPPSLVCAAGAESPTSLAWCGDLNASVLPLPDTTRVQRTVLTVPLQARAARHVLVIAIARGNFVFVDEIELRGPAPGDMGLRSKPKAASADAQSQRAGPLGKPFSTVDLAAVGAAQRRLWAVREALPATPVDLVAGADATAEEAARLAHRAATWRYTGAPRLTVRRVDPWARTTPWSDLQPTRADTLRLWPGAWGAAAIEVASADRSTQRVRIGLERSSRSAPVGTLREVIAVETRDGGWVGDALPLASESLRIEPGRVRQLWIDVDATQAVPGFHRIVATVDRERVVIPLQVVDWRAPVPPLGAINWTYPTKMALLRVAPEEAVRDNVAHGIDSWCLPYESVPWPDPAAIDAQGHLTRAPDFSASDRQLSLYPYRTARRIGWYLHFSAPLDDPSTGRFRHPWMSKPWQRAFHEWLDAWLVHLREMGIDEQRLFLQPFDETTAPRARELYAHLHAVRPDLRLMLTLGGEATPEALRAFGTAIRQAVIEREELAQNVEWIAAMQAQGVEVWTYDVIAAAKTAAPLLYRGLAWEAWARGLAGCGFWGYGDSGETSGDAWSDFDAGALDFTVVYGRAGAPQPLRETFVPSKRWQAFRIGMQETALLESALPRRPELRQAVLAALGRPDFDADAWRRRLLLQR
jgi:hypothetical protein